MACASDPSRGLPVLRISGMLEALDARMASHVLDMRAVHEGLVRRLEHIEQRVSALEAGFVERRRRD